MTDWAWAGLTVVAAGLAAGPVQWLAAQVAMQPLRRAGPVREPCDDHPWLPELLSHGARPTAWTERARLAWPVLRTLAWGQLGLPALWAILCSLAAEPMEPVTGFWLAPAVALAAFAGAGRVSWRLEAQVRQRPLTWADWCRDWMVQVLFFLTPWVVAVLVLLGLPPTFDWTAAGLVLTGVFVILVLNVGGSLVVGRWVGLVRPAPERLQTVVELAAQRLGLPPPRTCRLRWSMANALAFPCARAIAVTDRALETLGDSQLLAICVHELAHLGEPRRIHLARLAGQLVWVPLALTIPLTHWVGGWGIALALGACWAGLVLVYRLANAMERRADTAARQHESAPGAYAAALERLHEVNLIPAVIHGRGLTHPELYDRLQQAGAAPGYARPQPPPRWPARLGLGVMLVTACILAAVWGAARRLVLDIPLMGALG